MRAHAQDQRCIVFDGETVMWMLYVWSGHWGVGLTCSWVHGGQSLHWYHLVKNFFELFLRQGIRCLVFTDGVVESVRPAPPAQPAQPSAAAAVATAAAAPPRARGCELRCAAALTPGCAPRRCW